MRIFHLSFVLWSLAPELILELSGLLFNLGEFKHVFIQVAFLIVGQQVFFFDIILPLDVLPEICSTIDLPIQRRPESQSKGIVNIHLSKEFLFLSIL